MNDDNSLRWALAIGIAAFVVGTLALALAIAALTVGLE